MSDADQPPAPPLESAHPVHDQVARVADELAIRTLVANLARFADGPDVEAYVALFTPDAEWLLPGAPRRGHDDIRAGSVERRQAGQIGPGSHTRHVVTTVTVELAPGGDAAVARSTWQFFADTATTPRLVSMGTYEDEVVRFAGGWRVARRTIEVG